MGNLGSSQNLNLVTVYALIDPNTQEVRYVGRTYNVKSRFRSHLQIRFILSKTSAKVAWIRMLGKQKKIPILKIIEENISPQNAGTRERYWIVYYDQLGMPLFNYNYRPRKPDTP